MARTASSAALRTGSHIFTAVASTVSEKKTFPSETTTSESTRASGKAVPPGDGTLAKAASTCSLFTVMITVHFVGATIGKAAGWSMWRATTETG